MQLQCVTSLTLLWLKSNIHNNVPTSDVKPSKKSRLLIDVLDFREKNGQTGVYINTLLDLGAFL